MSDTKVSCSDFIVSAVRVIRPKADPAGRPSYAGVALGKVVALAKILYSYELVRQSLSTLLTERTILIAATKIVQVPPADRRSCYSTEIVSSIPSTAPLDSDQWFLNAEGAAFTPKRTQLLSRPKGYSAWLLDLMVYVIADGLPKKITQVKAWQSRS